MYFLTASLISYIFVRPIYSTNTGAPACPPRLLKTRCTGQGEEDRDREIDKYCLNAPLPVVRVLPRIFICAYFYSTMFNKLSHRTAHESHQQILEKSNREVFKKPTSLDLLWNTMYQRLRGGYIFFKIISCVVVSTQNYWKVAKFDSRLLFLIAFWRHCVLCACYVGEILDDDISFWT